MPMKSEYELSLEEISSRREKIEHRAGLVTGLVVGIAGGTMALFLPELIRFSDIVPDFPNPPTYWRLLAAAGVGGLLSFIGYGFGRNPIGESLADREYLIDWLSRLRGL